MVASWSSAGEAGVTFGAILSAGLAPDTGAGTGAEIGAGVGVRAGAGVGATGVSEFFLRKMFSISFLF